MEKELIICIREILDKGYEIKLTKNSIQIVETFKSESREEYFSKNAFECFGSLKYFDKNTMHITLSKLREKNKDL